MSALDALFALPVPALVGLGLLALVQSTLQLWGIIDLVRRPAADGGRKWLWGAVVVAGGVVGAAVYLAVGRTALAQGAAPPDDRFAADDPARTRTDAIDRLYGDRDGRT